LAVAAEWARPHAVGLDRREAAGLDGLEVGQDVVVGIAVEEGRCEWISRPGADIWLEVHADQRIEGVRARGAREEDGVGEQESGAGLRLHDVDPRAGLPGEARPGPSTSDGSRTAPGDALRASAAWARSARGTCRFLARGVQAAAP